MYEPKANATDTERLAVIEHFVSDMHQRLFGNGQPGVIEKLESRVGRIESWMWRIVGAGGLVVLMLEAYRALKGA